MSDFPTIPDDPVMILLSRGAELPLSVRITRAWSTRRGRWQYGDLVITIGRSYNLSQAEARGLARALHALADAAHDATEDARDAAIREARSVGTTDA